MAAGGSDVNESYNIKHLLKSDAVYKYILDTTVFPREHECMRDLRLLTDKHQRGIMQSTPEEAQLLIKIAGARNTIEVGVFTGYSLLATTLALPEDAKVVAIDVNRKDFELGLPFIQKAGMAHKVDFREGTALDRLDELLAAAEGDAAVQYDFAFVDADKQNYGRYHEQLLQLVRVGGTIVYDNTLWGGTVAGVAVPSLDVLPGVVVDGVLAFISEFLKGFNAELAADPCVDVCQIAVGDGLTICRRLV